MARHYSTNSRHKQRPEYWSWVAMKRRCLDPKNPAYHNYGGRLDRPIAVCERWLGKSGFANFLADMGQRPTLEHTLDRIDNDGDYAPENCRWATPLEQSNNSRTNVLMEWNGKRLSIAAWAREMGLNYQTVFFRLQKGWSLEMALTTPPRQQPKFHPQNRQARIAVMHAVSRGKLPRVKTLACARCGQPAKEYHHHKGYAQEHWLDVEPLCKKCHEAEKR